MPDQHEAPEIAATDNETSDAPANREERRAMKKSKGKNETKGVGQGVSRSGFNPKRINTTSHKEFTNRKSG